MREFNFGAPDELEASQLEDQRRMLAALIASTQNRPAYSDKAALANMATNILGQVDMAGAGRRQVELAQKRQAEQQAEMGRLVESAQAGRGDLARLLVQSRNPEMRMAGLKVALEKPKAPERFKLNPGEIVKDETGRVIADNPKPIEAPKEPESVAALKAEMKAAGIDPESPIGKSIFEKAVKKRTEHQQPTQVTVNTGKKFGETLATEVAQQVAQSAESARGAVDTLNTAKQIESAIASGKVMAGPGTTGIMWVQQAINAPSTEEGRVKTREVIQGLSKLTLAARKQLKGQGQVSDFEGKLLAKAESGDIDGLTVPEIQSLVKTAARVANASITQHQQYLKKIKDDPELKGLAPFFDISTPQPGTQNPAIDDILKLYPPKN